MTPQELRTELIKILARNADEPHLTVDRIIELFERNSKGRTGE